MAGYPAAIAESEMYISQLLFTVALDTSHKPVAGGHHILKNPITNIKTHKLLIH